MGDKTKGLYHKFDVKRTDGKSKRGGKHDGCDYFVLDRTHDPFAIPAMRAYSRACRDEYPALALDIDVKVGTELDLIDSFVTVTEQKHQSHSIWIVKMGRIQLSIDQSEATAMAYASSVRRVLREQFARPKP